jgi:hypothetical protein
MHSSGVLGTCLLYKRVPTKNRGSPHSARISASNAQGTGLPACVNGVDSHACASNDSSAHAAKESSWDVSARTTGSVCPLTSSAAAIVPIPSVGSLTMVNNPRNVTLSVSTSHTPPDTSLLTSVLSIASDVPDANAIVAKEIACEMGTATCCDPQGTSSGTVHMVKPGDHLHCVCDAAPFTASVFAAHISTCPKWSRHITRHNARKKRKRVGTIKLSSQATAVNVATSDAPISSV